MQSSWNDATRGLNRNNTALIHLRSTSHHVEKNNGDGKTPKVSICSCASCKDFCRFSNSFVGRLEGRSFQKFPWENSSSSDAHAGRRSIKMRDAQKCPMEMVDFKRKPRFKGFFLSWRHFQIYIYI